MRIKFYWCGFRSYGQLLVGQYVGVNYKPNIQVTETAWFITCLTSQWKFQKYYIKYHGSVVKLNNWLNNVVKKQLRGRKFCMNKANLRDLIAATSLIILLTLDSILKKNFSLCDLEIRWMNLKNNHKAPFPCFFKFYASFHGHRSFQI